MKIKITSALKQKQCGTFHCFPLLSVGTFLVALPTNVFSGSFKYTNALFPEIDHYHPNVH